VLPLCSLNRLIMFSVFDVQPSGVKDDDDDSLFIYVYSRKEQKKTSPVIKFTVLPS